MNSARGRVSTFLPENIIFLFLKWAGLVFVWLKTQLKLTTMTLQQTNQKIASLQQLDAQLISIALTAKDEAKKAAALKLSQRLLKSMVNLMMLKESLKGNKVAA